MTDQKNFSSSLLAVGLANLMTSLISAASVFRYMAADGIDAFDFVVTVGFFGVLFGGLFTLSRIGLRYLPRQAAGVRRRVIPIFLAVYSCLSLVSFLTSALTLGVPAAKEAQLQGNLENVEVELDVTKGAIAATTGLIPTLEGGELTGSGMTIREDSGGAISDSGSGRGKVAAELASITSTMATAKLAVIASRAAAAPLLRDANKALERARRIREDKTLGFDKKQERLKVQVDNLKRVIVALKATIPTDTLRNAADAITRDYKHMGLSNAAAARIAGAFTPIATNLRDGLADIERIQERETPGWVEKRDVQLVLAHLDRVGVLVAFALCLELMPAMLIAIAIMTADNRADRGSNVTPLAEASRRRSEPQWDTQPGDSRDQAHPHSQRIGFHIPSQDQA